MSRRNLRLHLQDMLQSCEDIAATISGMTEAQFPVDPLRQKAVVRDLEVLGEAARHVPDSVRATVVSVPWRTLVAMRNRLIHEYFGVDLTIVYRTAVADIPSIVPVLRRMLKDIEH